MKRLRPRSSCLSCGIAVVCAVVTALVCSAYAGTTDTAVTRRLPRFLELKVSPTPAPTARATSPTLRTAKPAPSVTTTTTEPKKTFALATDLIKRGRRAQAKTLLQRLAREHPKSDLAPQALVQIATIEDNLEEADNILARVILDYPNTEWAEVAWYKRGEVNMLLWDHKTALKMFEQYLERNPRAKQAATIRRQMVVCRLKLGDAQKALTELEQLCRDNPEVATEPETLETLAECHVELGRCDRALDPLQTLMKKYPAYANFARAFMLHALCLEDQNRFSEAMDAYGRLIEQFPRSPEAGLAKLRWADLQRPLTLQEDDLSTAIITGAAGPTTSTLVISPALMPSPGNKP